MPKSVASYSSSSVAALGLGAGAGTGLGGSGTTSGTASFFFAGGLATATGTSDPVELLRFFLTFTLGVSSSFEDSVPSEIAAVGFVSSFPVGRAGVGVTG
jgi:hypothetical protein